MHLECQNRKAGTYLNFSTIAKFNNRSFALLIGTPQKVLVYDIAFSYENDAEWSLKSGKEEVKEDENHPIETRRESNDKLLLSARKPTDLDMSKKSSIADQNSVYEFTQNRLI